MIPSSPPPRFEPGTRVRVTQRVRVGHREWLTHLVGLVEKESVRPIGGMEMGGKASFCFQPTIRLRKEDGEVTVVAIDNDTQVEAFPNA